MKLAQVALQLYTIRSHTQTLEDFRASMQRVKKIGYPAVQISGAGPIPPADLRAACEAEGLVICATHEPGKKIVEEPNAVVDRLGALGCRHTAYPYPHMPLDTEDDAKRLAAALNEAGAVLRKSDMVLSYHNHQIEFRRFGTRTILEILMDETDPSFVKAELDTYWVHFGGGNPAAWCKKFSGRIPLLHMKDYCITKENKPEFAPIGSGNLDFSTIVPAADAGGTEWFIVEQDGGFEDPFEDVTKSLRTVKEQLCT